MKSQIVQIDSQELLREDFFQNSYLDNYDLETKFSLPSVTVIVPTFNRCPHPEVGDNPLSWCLKSLLKQKGGVLNEIIIIDDASTDYTEKIVKSFQRDSFISIVYLKNEKNKGSSISRNVAVSKSKNDLVFFIDDDCIATKYMLFGAVFTLSRLNKSVVALHVPIYHRKALPTLIELNQIGVADLEKGVITGNWEGFPREYAEDLENNFLDSNLKILNPFLVKNMAGVFVINKKVFEEVGGFPEFFTWKNGYREETDLALKLSEKGYEIYFTPDPKFHCIHLRYGTEDLKEDDLEFHLKEFVKISNTPRVNTGNRVCREEWFFSFVLSTYVTLKKRNPSAAKSFLYETYKNFVVNNNVSMAGVGGKIDDLHTRRSLFDKAVVQGNILVPDEEDNKND